MTSILDREHFPWQDTVHMPLTYFVTVESKMSYCIFDNSANSDQTAKGSPLDGQEGLAVSKHIDIMQSNVSFNTQMEVRWATSSANFLPRVRLFTRSRPVFFPFFLHHAFPEIISSEMLAAYSCTAIQLIDSRIGEYRSVNTNLCRRTLGLDQAASLSQNIDCSPGYRRYTSLLLPTQFFFQRGVSYFLLIWVASIGLLNVYCQCTQNPSLYGTQSTI
jgi:hypothetical protein